MGVFSGEEQAAFKPQRKLKPSEWCEQYRIIAGPNAAQPGKWRNEGAPYLAGIMDAIALPDTEEIVVYKAAQVGYSELLVNLVSYFATQQPGPLMMVLPSRQTGSEFLRERLYPSLQQQPELAALLPSNSKKLKSDGCQLATMPIYTGYSGSARSLASRSIRYLFLDEIDKYAKAPREGDTIKLAVERTITFSRRKIIYGSTPTDRAGNIAKQYEAATQQYGYYCPCPYCGYMQTLAFIQVKWSLPPELKTAAAQADYILDHPDSVSYECVDCQARWTDSERIRATQAGEWRDQQGRSRISGRRIAFAIPGLLSRHRKLHLFAAEFLKSKHDPAELQNFKNSWLGEVFEQVEHTKTVEQVEQSIPSLVGQRQIPAWGHYLISAADTQLGTFYYSTYAFGNEGKVCCVDSGIAQTTAELKQRTLDCSFSTSSGSKVNPHCLMIDSGGITERTTEVYSFAATDRRIIAIKGSSGRMQPPVKQSSAGAGNFHFYTIDTHTFKDQWAFAIESKKVWTYEGVGSDWFRHLSAEQKIRNTKQELVWQPKYKNIANHYFDCMVYALAGCYLLIMKYGPIPDIAVAPVVNPQPQQQATTAAVPVRNMIRNIGKLR